jgi:acyl transferase domain-containing protein
MSEERGKRDYASLLKKALLEIQGLRARLGQERHPDAEPIAIVGMGCRFPGGAGSPESYWRILRDGLDVISDVPPDRWDKDADFAPEMVAPEGIHTRRGGFLDRIDHFDPAFFALSEGEAAGMDPQQRLLLEVAWETFENAAIPAERLAGSRTAVFVGITNQGDFFRRLRETPARSGTGISNCIAANRLSYAFDLQGPSVALDTACSSSLVALHLACRGLRARDADLALVAGVNAILSPQWMVAFSMAGMLSPDGRCKSFDASADGFVRSEGCGAVLLKRLSDARRDGDRVLALIRGTAVNQDGRGSALTVPNGAAQQAVIRAALADAGVAPAAIGYVEAHGIGTEMGDPIEVAALKAVLSEGRTDGGPCRIGSAKANLGHGEAASGIAGLIKAVLVLRHGAIPPQLHLHTPNPHLGLEGTPFAIPTRLEPWPAGPRPRLTCVNSFGLGGTNAHAVVEEPPAEAGAAPRQPRDVAREAPLHLVPLSAKSEKALRDLAGRYAAWLEEHPEALVAEVAATAATGRSHFHHRLALIVPDRETLRRRLAGFARGDAVAGAHGVSRPGGDPPRVGLLFGERIEHPGAGDLDAHPVFRDALERCARAFRDHGGAELQPGAAEPWRFALQYATYELLRRLGVTPLAVLGHGIGEVVAAVAAGACGAEAGLVLAQARERARSGAPAAGAGIERLSFAAPGRTLISGATGKAWPAREAPGVEYWRKQIARTPDASRGIDALAEKGCDTVVAIGGPTPEPSPGSPPRRLDLLGGGPEDRWSALLITLAELYARGVDVEWRALHGAQRRVVDLPTYPFQRVRCWPDASALRPYGD